jgi:hypothetical protein
MTNTAATKPAQTPFDWQEELARDIRDTESSRWLLTAPTGAGKTVAALVLLARLRERIPEARIFCAIPTSASASHFAERLRRWESAGEVNLVSPSWYRRKKSKSAELEDIWAEGATYVFDASLLQRPSATSSLQEVSWDLGVVDDLDLLLDEPNNTDESSKLVPALDRLLTTGRCRRFLALSQEVHQPFSKPLSVRRRDQAIVEAKGVTLDRSTLDYERTEAERALYEELARIGDHLAPNANQAAGLTRRTFEAQTSSLYTVDQWLYGLKRLVDTSTVARTAKPVGMQAASSDFWRGIEDLRELWNDPDDAEEWVETLFDCMAAVETDAKADCVEQFLTDASASHVCCMTFDAKTAKYLDVTLEATDRPLHSLESELRLDEREQVIETFVEEGGVLLTPDDVLPDLDLVEADAVVHYDLPMRTGSMQRRTAAVLPRTGDTLSAYALRDTTQAVDGEDALLRQYGFLDEG